ncbi:nuclear transport factor 2 family protein [Streptomyces sp. TG1A-8]|uniref:nuclear transport factor 2 family protein n=1 Tax=Streptomyces sp. TG1A-8 TaxID=3051385 RepID=UPI00265BE80A|nr:nuclear transport factor 2 family protein [Streptomyces sp. TG1A-8]MDO0925319.1 nuclear transport factor 2 family protein [Streptomyces sp. TG1A-8]
MTATSCEVVEQVLRAGREMDTETFVSLIAPDGYVEWPFQPQGLPGRLEGREQIREFLNAQSKALVRFDEYRNTVIHETTDPEVVIVEYDAHGTVIPTGAPLHQTIIAVLRIRDGLVVSYRDYLNPLVLAETLASVGTASMSQSDTVPPGR